MEPQEWMKPQGKGVNLTLITTPFDLNVFKTVGSSKNLFRCISWNTFLLNILPEA